jgi:hypothetical protein
LVEQQFVGWSSTARFYLKRAVRLETAQEEGYDPFLFLLENADDPNDVKVWPFYWIKNKHGKWHVGQFPPLLSRDQLNSLLSQL